MAELIKPWSNGGNLSVTYDGNGDGSAIFESDPYEGIDREMSVTFKSGDIKEERIVRQEGIRQPIGLSEGGIFRVANGGRFGVLKELKPYTEVEYIESTGTQWINTGVNIDTSTDEVELVIQGLTTTLYKWFFGEHDNGARFGLGSGDGPNKRNVAYGKTTYKVNDTQIYNSKHTFVANKNGVFLDGVKITNYASFTSSSTIYLFNLNISSQSSYTSSARIWSYKQTRSGKELINLMPVLDNNDVACMYDKVSKEFFYNKGTGEFIAGNIK